MNNPATNYDLYLIILRIFCRLNICFKLKLLMCLFHARSHRLPTISSSRGCIQIILWKRMRHMGRWSSIACTAIRTFAIFRIWQAIARGHQSWTHCGNNIINTIFIFTLFNYTKLFKANIFFLLKPKLVTL